MSSRDFEKANVKLMARDVVRVMTEGGDLLSRAAMAGNAEAVAPVVTERAFEEYHLYTLEPSALAKSYPFVLG